MTRVCLPALTGNAPIVDGGPNLPCVAAHTLTAQIVDDVLDLTGSSTILGKPALNDMKSGVATAPVLFAAQQQPQLCTLIKRKFKSYGDVDEVRQVLFCGRVALTESFSCTMIQCKPPSQC